MALDTVSKLARPDGHKQETVRWLARLGLAGLSGFVVAVVLLHWLQPNLDPLNEAMSYYVHGAGGWLLTVGLLGLGTGSLALAIGIEGAVDGPGARAGRWLLTIWSVGVLVGGVFAADPPGNWDKPLSASGLIHGNAALIAFLALPAAALVLARSFWHDDRWQRTAGLLLSLAIASALSLGAFMASLVPVMISPGPPKLFGLAERILLGMYVVWLGAVAAGLLRAEERSRTTA